MKPGRPVHDEGTIPVRDGRAHGFLASVGRETLRERVYDALRRSLIKGAFEAGEVLRIDDLAQALQTSAMPVREGLGRLVSEQALEAMPNRSVRVPLISRDRLDDLIRARCLVEGELTRLALPNLEAADFDALRARVAACEGAAEDDGATRTGAWGLDHAFHFRIYRAARSQVLMPMAESLWLQSGPYLRAAGRLGAGGESRQEPRHERELIAALERGDRTAAIRALTRAITRFFGPIREQLAAKRAHD